LRAESVRNRAATTTIISTTVPVPSAVTSIMIASIVGERFAPIQRIIDSSKPCVSPSRTSSASTAKAAVPAIPTSNPATRKIPSAPTTL
jgi:hypothetical protein